MAKRINLTQGKYAIVDNEDYDRLSKYKWYANKNGQKFYAERSIKINGKRTIQRMHRLLMSSPNGVGIDHINGDGLDNRKSNLRLSTTSQNAMNRKGYGTSKYLGVCWNKKQEKWQAQIQTFSQKIGLGFYHDEIEAAKAYDVAARKHHGNFANPNF